MMSGVLAMTNCSSSNTDSSKFMKKAWQDGVAEIQVCQLALQRSQNPDVRQFAERMMRDHIQIDDELKQLAARKNVELPQGIGAEKKLTNEKLALLSGSEFDKQFMEHNVEDHQGDVKDFKEQVDTGTDADVKAFAVKTLAMLQTHLQLSKDVAGKVKS
jgi:putative membrane protein